MYWDVYTMHGNNSVGTVYAFNGDAALRKARERFGSYVVYVECGKTRYPTLTGK